VWVRRIITYIIIVMGENLFSRNSVWELPLECRSNCCREIIMVYSVLLQIPKSRNNHEQQWLLESNDLCVYCLQVSTTSGRWIPCQPVWIITVYNNNRSGFQKLFFGCARYRVGRHDLKKRRTRWISIFWTILNRANRLRPLAKRLYWNVSYGPRLE